MGIWSEIRFWLLCLLYVALMVVFYAGIVALCLSPIILLMWAFKLIFL